MNDREFGVTAIAPVVELPAGVGVDIGLDGLPIDVGTAIGGDDVAFGLGEPPIVGFEGPTEIGVALELTDGFGTIGDVELPPPPPPEQEANEIASEPKRKTVDRRTTIISDTLRKRRAS